LRFRATLIGPGKWDYELEAPNARRGVAGHQGNVYARPCSITTSTGWRTFVEGMKMYVGPAPGLRTDGDANGLWPAIGDDERRA
jgi:hypothetical protein